MTRQFTRWLLITMVVPIVLTVAAPFAQAETNEQYEACKTLGGEYEERRTDCDPECKTTYICRFKEGWSRVCDEQGVCSQVQDGASGNTSSSSETAQQEEGDSDNEWDNESGQSFEDCVADAGDYCRDQCADEEGFDAVDCARSCLESQEGQCEEHDYESDDSYGSDDECVECVDLCEDACDRLRQSWRRDNCLSECKSRCDYVCD